MPQFDAHVMVVEDVTINTRIIRMILESLVSCVTSYERGEAALAAAKKDPPDLMLLDIHMPQMDGYEVCAHMQSDPELKSIPIIFLTALDTDEGKIRGFREGGVDYITKPFNPEEVKARVTSHLRLRFLQHELERQNDDLERQVEAQVRQIAESQMATIFALAKLSEYRDQETGQHLERVREFCRQLATSLGRSPSYNQIIDAEFIVNTAMASVLHDIGKVAIPDAILQKPARLTVDEREMMQRHTVIGAETLEEVYRNYPENHFIQIGIEIARSHHEKYNGGGYPDGLQGETIPLAARIMSVADVYDALRTPRRYKRAWSHEEVCDELRRLSGEDFDPDVINAFLKEESTFARIYTEMSRDSLTNSQKGVI
ncbi:MAG: two-component system response regulator [Desulfuromonas sp.]|nr:MAG: two-component system response regulator [Desulfuromonas sp.]